MTQAIGEAAGKVWNALSGNGGATVAELARKTRLSRNVVERALGWLAREDKLVFDRARNVETVRLK